MSHERPGRAWKLAALSFAVAAAVSGTPLEASSGQALEQLQQYCRASWRNAGIAPQDWSDCTQQAIVELLERVGNDGLHEAILDLESPSRRELNRSVWRTTQRWRRAVRTSSFDDHLAADATSPDPLAEQRWTAVESVARQTLTPRQWQILCLLRDGWKIAEIARELDIPAPRVSDEKYKAISRLREQLS